MAKWRLNGDAADAVGTNGTLLGGFYADDGAIPHDIRIPQRNVTPSVDGFCTGSEYDGAMQVTVSNGAPRERGGPRTCCARPPTSGSASSGFTPPTWSGR